VQGNIHGSVLSDDDCRIDDDDEVLLKRVVTK